MSASPGAGAGRGRRGAGQGYCGGQGPGAGASAGPDAGPGPSTFPDAGGGRYRRSVLETSILTLLASTQNHGYDLMEQVSNMASDLVCIDPGSMYRLLRGLEEQGLVSSSWQPAETGPSRRVYAITDQGLEALEMMAESLALRAKSMQRIAQSARQAVADAKSGTPEK